MTTLPGRRPLVNNEGKENVPVESCAPLNELRVVPARSSSSQHCLGSCGRTDEGRDGASAVVLYAREDVLHLEVIVREDADAFVVFDDGVCGRRVGYVCHEYTRSLVGPGGFAVNFFAVPLYGKQSAVQAGAACRSFESKRLGVCCCHPCSA